LTKNEVGVWGRSPNYQHKTLLPSQHTPFYILILKYLRIFLQKTKTDNMVNLFILELGQGLYGKIKIII